MSIRNAESNINVACNHKKARKDNAGEQARNNYKVCKLYVGSKS